MKTQHTPGPWINADGFIHSEHTEERPLVAQLHNCSVSDYDNSLVFTEVENFEANARLISAAPELLEACVKAFDNLRNGESKTKYRLIECLNSLEEAIAKAKGE